MSREKTDETPRTSQDIVCPVKCLLVINSTVSLQTQLMSIGNAAPVFWFLHYARVGRFKGMSVAFVLSRRRKLRKERDFGRGKHWTFQVSNAHERLHDQAA